MISFMEARIIKSLEEVKKVLEEHKEEIKEKIRSKIYGYFWFFCKE